MIPASLRPSVLAACLILAPSAAGCTSIEQSDPADALPSACEFQPSHDNTGPRSEVEASDVTVLRDGESLEGVAVPALRVEGSEVLVRDVEVGGSILVTGDDVVIDHVTAGGIAISSASRVRVARSEIAGGPEDGIHITSDGPDLVHDVVLSHNLVRDSRAPADAHYDGTQVRGVRGITIECSVYDAGHFRDIYNAAIYIEDANGGATDVRIEHNWLLGSAWSLMIGVPDVSLVGNRVGGDIKWGTCYMGDVRPENAPVERGNVLLATGEVVALCGEEPTRNP